MFADCTRQLLDSRGRFLKDSTKRRAGHYKAFGQLSAMALIHGSSGPRVICSSQASIVVGGVNNVDVDLHDITDPHIISQLEPVSKLRPIF